MKNIVTKLSNKMTLHEMGFWVSEDTGSRVSYPDIGNALCAEIEDHSFWFRHRNRVIIEGVRNYPPKGIIFDIGGGNGFVSRGLAEAGFDCALIEPGEKGARKAVERGVKHVFCSTLEAIRFENASIPAVGLFDVIEHVESDLRFLKELNSLLIPGGRLYATVPAYTFLWSTEDEYAGHYRRYTRHSIESVLSQAGFEIEYVSYFFRFLPPAIFMFRTLPSVLGRSAVTSVKDPRKSHSAGQKIGGKILKRLLKNEIDSIRKRKQLLFGGSCFVIAKS